MARSKREISHGQETDLTKVIHDILDYCEDPARIMEVYYWSREPGLAEIMRQFVMLPPNVQNTLIAFFDMLQCDAHTVSVIIGKDGAITLSSPAVTDLVEAMVPAHASQIDPDLLR
ncbi:MAG: hypothetical protein HY056_09800 [Proteobacteria bacterium]|nr:hypothetical protein [Pseudomonadota bacterium]